MKHVLVRLAFLGFLFPSLAFVNPALAEETIVIAAEDDWPPYSSIKADRSGPEGFTPELVRAVFKLKGVDVRFLTVPFARCLHYAETGRTVGCFNATIVEGNRNTFHWHPTPMFSEELAIFARSDQPGDHLTLKDLEGQTVSVTIGYTYPTELMQNQAITRFAATSDAQQLRMLATGRVRFALVNTMPGYLRIHAEPSLQGRIRQVGRVSVDGFWVAFSKAHPDGKRMAGIFEDGLQQLKASGRYDEMLEAFRRRIGYQPGK
ncbi:transporter substrate-binding domain-containing protein [Zoogloea sp.]|uniref:substrate-binding periplasmic protein n=1 Tax=Zoogloea sp. TaxID=49181 RepID=UPI001416B098|nr:MAG: amino acid ABC transporter substrate-binding protein [Zoogloea sp.]